MLLLPLRYQHSASLLGFWWWVDRRDSNPLVLVSPFWGGSGAPDFESALASFSKFSNRFSELL